MSWILRPIMAALFVQLLSAQIETARIAGTVTDSNKAVIVNARIALTNIDTGACSRQLPA